MKLPPNHRLQLVFSGDGEVSVRYYVDNEFGLTDKKVSSTNRDMEITAEAKKALKDLLTPLMVQNFETMETIAHRDTAQLSYLTSINAKLPELKKASLTPTSEETTDEAPRKQQRGRGDR